MPEVPFDLILQVKARTRAAAGLAEYNPSDPRLPSLPSLSSTIAVSDPSPLDVCCKNCKGRLLREAESALCLYCGTRPDHESVPEPICFSSTTGYQWLLHSLQLNGTEIVETTTKPDQDEYQNMRKSYTSLSDFLNLKMPWPVPESVPGIRSSEKQLTENERQLSLTSKSIELSGTDAEEATDDFGTMDGKGFPTVSAHQKVQSNTSESSSTQNISQDIEEWEANFQSANSESNHGKDTLFNPFPSTSDGSEDKLHNSVKIDGSRNLDVDLSSHIDSVFGYREVVNDGKPNRNPGVSTELDFWNPNDLPNLRPNASNGDGGFDPLINGNDSQKGDRIYDNLKSDDLFAGSDDLKNLGPSVSNTDDGFGGFISGEVDHTGESFKDFSSTPDLFPGSDDLQNLPPNVPKTDVGFDIFLSRNHGQEADYTLNDFKGFSSSADLFLGSDLRPNVPNTNDGFDDFLIRNHGENDNPTMDSFKVVSSGRDMFQGSDDLQNASPNTNSEDDFGVFLDGNHGQKDEPISENFKDVSSNSDLFPHPDNLQNPSLNTNSEDDFGVFIGGNHGQKDDPISDNFKDISSSSDLFPRSDDFPSLSSNIDKDDFGVFISGSHDQKDDPVSDNFKDISSRSDLFPVSDAAQNLGPNIVHSDDGFDAFLSRNHYQRGDHTLDNFKDFSSADLFSGSNDLPILRPTSSTSENKHGDDISFGHLPSTSGGVRDEFFKFETLNRSRNLDIGLDPLADSGIGKPIYQAGISSVFDVDAWENLRSIPKNGVAFDNTTKDSHRDDHSLHKLNMVLPDADSFPHPQPQVTDITDSKTHHQEQDQALDEDPFDEWSGFVGSNSLGDPPKSAPSENKQSVDISSGHLPSASVEYINEFPRSEVVRSKSLDANLGLHSDSVFGLWGDRNNKKGNSNGATSAASSNWNSDGMWMNMIPSDTKIAAAFDPFASKKDIQKDDHTIDDSRDFFSRSDSLTQTTNAAKLEMQGQGHEESVHDFPNDEWNDFMGSTSLQDPPKDVSSENRIGSSPAHLPTTSIGRSKSLEFDLFSDTISELPKDDINAARLKNNASVWTAFGDWNSDDIWKDFNLNPSNMGGDPNSLYTTTKNGQFDDHILYNKKDMFPIADLFLDFKSASTVMVKNENQHQEHTMNDENDEWNDFIGPAR